MAEAIQGAVSSVASTAASTSRVVLGDVIVIVLVALLWRAGAYVLSWVEQYSSWNLSDGQRIAATLLSSVVVLAAIQAVTGKGILDWCESLAGVVPGGVCIPS